MDRTHSDTIDRYEAGAKVPADAALGLTPAELDAFPVPGTWSIRQILVHLLDSDMAATHRMKRVAAEDRPLIIAYDETAFAQKLGYDTMDIGLTCELFRLNRLHTAAMLRALPGEAFLRQGVHNQRGLVSLGELVRGYVGHLEHHVGFIRKKRELLGKPLAW